MAITYIPGGLTGDALIAAINTAIEQINNGGIDTNSIAPAAVVTETIAVDSVGIDQLQEASIISAYIQDAQITNAKIADAAITNAKIGNAEINDAKISSVSASKLTAGTIDASTINVTNLNADNITAGAINGKRIEDGAVSFAKLAQTTADAIITVGGGGKDYPDLPTALAALPKIINHNIELRVYDDVGHTIIPNFDGTGTLTIKGMITLVPNHMPSLYISSCQCQIEVMNFHIDSYRYNGAYNISVEVTSSRQVDLSDCVIDAVNTIGVSYYHSNGSVIGGSISNKTFAVQAEKSLLTCAMMDGTGNTTVFLSSDSAVLSIIPPYTITGTTLTSTSMGGIITDPSGDIFNNFPKCITRQNNTTNIAVSNQKIAFGWGVIQGNGTAGVNETVSFNEAFDDYPVVIISSIGARTSAPTDIQNFNTSAAQFAEARAISPTGFIAQIYNRDAATNLPSTSYFGYAWVAIGTKARL